MFVRVVWTVFAGVNVGIRFELCLRSELDTGLVENLQILLELAALHSEVRQFILIEIPQLARNLLKIRIEYQSTDGVKLKLSGVLDLIAESFAGFEIDNDRMCSIKMADRVGLESEPSASPFSRVPLIVKPPFLLTSDTPIFGVCGQSREVLFKMSKVVSETGFSEDIIFRLLVDLRAAIRSGLGLKIRDFVEPLELGSVLALFEDDELGERPGVKG